jgi:tape measure domain-containing protein
MTVAELTARISVVGDKAVQAALTRMKAGLKQTAEAAKNASVAFAGLNGVMAVGAGVIGVQAALSYDAQVRGLATYSKNAEELTLQLNRMKEIAKLPGLGLPEVRQGVLNMEAAGVSAEMAERSMMAFGNALALVGRGKDDLAEVTRQFGQMKALGKVNAEEMNVIKERIPQVSKAMQAAFGTASPELIGKLGLDVDTIFDKLITQLEKLPKTAGGAITTFENLQDAIKEAFLPIGRGLLDMFSASAPGMDNFIMKIGEISQSLGEVLSAIGKSGVLGEVLTKLFGGFAGGGDYQKGFQSFSANVLAFFHELPAIVNNITKTISYSFRLLFSEAKKEYLDAMNMMPFVGGQYNDRAKMATDSYNALVAESNAAQMPVDIARFAQEYLARIKASTKPQGLPTGLNFANPNTPKIPGGAIPAGGSSAGGKQSVLDKIEKNTRRAADFMDLRNQSIGGGPIANLGLTGAEYAGMGMRPRESIKLRSPISADTQIIRGLQDLMYGNMGFQTNGNAISKARF